MKIVWIWMVALAISALPVVWLARRNPRAVLTGALLPALLLVYALGGLGLGGAGAGPRGDLGTLLLMWIVVMAVLLGLLLFSFSRMKGSFVERIKWTAVGVGVWVFVGTMVTRASGEVNDLRVEAETQAFVKHAAQAQADQRRELDRTPERRRAVLDSVLAQMKQGELGYRPLGRLLVFGDATTAPERVVLWTVVTPGPKDTWAAYSFYGERLHQRLNALLQERGYPAKIGLGIAFAAAVDSAGGDEAYFGPDGANVMPQYPPDTVTGNRTRRIEAPRPRRAVKPRTL
jgi:hypothetical protein